MVDDRRTVTVTGLGVAHAPPDRAMASLAAETIGEDPGAALSACSVASNAMVEAALAAGVNRAAVQTTGLSLQPNWEHHRDEPRVAGYVARSVLSLVVEDIGRAGAVLTAVVAAGGEAARVHGVSLVVGDPAAAMATAREAAFTDARSKAEQYAALAGVGLGPLLSVHEDDRGGPPRPIRPGLQAEVVLAAVAVEPGESQLAVGVTASWELAAPASRR